MSFEYNYGLDEGAIAGLLVSLLSFLLSGGIGIVTYVFRSLGVYTIAKRRELKNPWMAWVPVVDNWILGSISDQYQYVSKGKVKNKRKWMIGLSIAMAVVYIAFWIVYIMLFASMFSGLAGNASEAEMMSGLVGPMVAMFGLMLPLMGISIALTIIRYIALYDLYNSVDPKNSVMYLVLSVLISVTEPFFIFFNRKKDLGMPPRKDRSAQIPQEPVCQAQDAAYEPVEPVAPVVEPATEAEPVAAEEPVIVAEPVTEPEAPAAEEAPETAPAEPIILAAAPAEEVYEELPEEPAAEADPWDEV